MAKAPKRAFVCNECGADYPRWQGQCSACQAWNTITEVRLAASPTVARNERLSGYAGNAGVAKVQKLSDISLEELPRFSTGFKEFDRVLGGGVVPGSAILIGGNPGAGKSTLLLQTLCKLAEQMKTLYVTGEESLQQVAMRAHRLGLPTANLNMLSETSIEQICLIAGYSVFAGQCGAGARNGGLPDAFCQNARRGDCDGRPRHQRRLAGWAEGARTLY